MMRAASASSSYLSQGAFPTLAHHSKYDEAVRTSSACARLLLLNTDTAVYSGIDIRPSTAAHALAGCVASPSRRQSKCAEASSKPRSTPARRNSSP